MTEGIERIAVLRALQIGDMLCAMPALRSLRAAYPEAHVTLIGLPWSRDFAARFPELIDDTLEFPGWPGMPEAPFDSARTLAFLKSCQEAPFDLTVQLHGSGLHSNTFVRMMGAGRSAGFYPAGAEPPGEDFVPYEARGHETRRLLRLASHLGWPDTGEDVTFPLRGSDRAECEQLSQELELRVGDYAIVHPGARDSRRRWPAEKFAVVATTLAKQGLRVLLTGVESERAQVEAVAAGVDAAVDIVCGRTSLGGLACLLAGARVLVSNDTGVAHLADALRVPSVVVFSYSDPERWAAPDIQLHRRFVEPTAAGAFEVSGEGPSGACRNTSFGRGEPVRVQDVVDAALELSSLGEAHAAAS